MKQHIETTEPLFTTLRQPHTVYRYNGANGRIYWRDIEGEPKLYLSVTTFIKRSMPTSPHLIEWIAKTGWDKSQEILHESADYGTFMHIEFGRLLISKELDLDGMETRLDAYVQENKLKWNTAEWVEDLKSDLLALAQFIVDHAVEPLAIEMVLCSDKYRFAGAIDLICHMDIEETGFFGETYERGGTKNKKGDPKESKRISRITAIIDAKSGRKGFYDDHVVQLAAYQQMVVENFPELKIDRVFNVAPKDWRGKPTYHLKDQTDAWNVSKFPHMVAMAEMDDLKPDRKITVMEGKIGLKKGHVGLEAGYRTMNLVDWIKDLKKKELEK